MTWIGIFWSMIKRSLATSSFSSSEKRLLHSVRLVTDCLRNGPLRG